MTCSGEAVYKSVYGPYVSDRADVHMLRERSDGHCTEQQPAQSATSPGLSSGKTTRATQSYSAVRTIDDVCRRQTWALKGFITSSGEPFALSPALRANKPQRV